MCNVEIQQQSECEGWSLGQNWIISKISWTSFQITLLAKAEVTLVPTTAGIFWWCGDVARCGSWMDASLSEPSPAQPAQPSPYSPAQPQWMSGSVVGLGSWTAGDCWAGNEYTTGTVASTSHPHYWSCRSSSISHQLGLAIFTLEIPE